MKYQYAVQLGDFPVIHFYALSPFEFETVEKAKEAGYKAAEKRGLKRSQVNVYTRKGVESA